MSEHKSADKGAQAHQPDYSKVMSLYKKLESKGLKAQADKIMADISSHYPADHPAPPEKIMEGLESILHHKTSSGHSSNSYLELATEFLIGAASLAGGPITGAIGLGTIAFYEYNKRNSSKQQKPAH